MVDVGESPSQEDQRGKLSNHMMHTGLIPSVHNMENCGMADELFQPVSRPKESFIGRAL
jgi:hypothetical protein